MFVMNLGCSPHFKQRGEVGFWRSCFSMPHRMSGRPYRQVKKRRHYWGGFSSPFSVMVKAHMKGTRQLRRPTALPAAASPAVAPPVAAPCSKGFLGEPITLIALSPCCAALEV
jgi:hypothetical protein